MAVRDDAGNDYIAGRDHLEDGCGTEALTGAVSFMPGKHWWTRLMMRKRIPHDILQECADLSFRIGVNGKRLADQQRRMDAIKTSMSAVSSSLQGEVDSAERVIGDG